VILQLLYKIINNVNFKKLSLNYALVPNSSRFWWTVITSLALGSVLKKNPHGTGLEAARWQLVEALQYSAYQGFEDQMYLMPITGSNQEIITQNLSVYYTDFDRQQILIESLCFLVYVECCRSKLPWQISLPISPFG